MKRRGLNRNNPRTQSNLVATRIIIYAAAIVIILALISVAILASSLFVQGGVAW